MAARPEDLLSKEEYETRALRVKEVEVNALQVKGYEVSDLQDLLAGVKKIQKLYLATEALANSPSALDQGYTFDKLLTQPRLLDELVSKASTLMGLSFFVSEASFKARCGVSKDTAKEILANIEAIRQYQHNSLSLSSKISRKIMGLPDPAIVFQSSKSMSDARKLPLQQFETSLDAYEKNLDKLLPEASSLTPK
ncbi:hypothetical protein BN59_01663 [Legionella massiliensis]|uniref:Uncharacterized protein n=1 Tax=Legionella massiliensis TaxID=1034943 RepID=A0A078KSF1_9GAMM|nr:hypothetical protein [Legionella massiliensis]CDZ77380.1 hypothetical protein BN59_01663 [Legionella massiliensis]CEE13118.1 hypothetical protein BN1094_01663 [Legionella massiliensis]